MMLRQQVRAPLIWRFSLFLLIVFCTALRLGGLFVSLFPRLQRNAFRFFVHPTAAIEAVVRANGLERRYYRKTLFWQVIVYTR